MTITNVKAESLTCACCKSNFLSSYRPRTGNDARGVEKNWTHVGVDVQRDQHSISSFYQCPDCGALWEELDEADPGNRLRHLNRISGGSQYQLRDRGLQ